METIRVFIGKNCHYKINIDSKGFLTESHLISFFTPSNNTCTISTAIKKIMQMHSIDKNEIANNIHRTKLNKEGTK